MSDIQLDYKFMFEHTNKLMEMYKAKYLELDLRIQKIHELSSGRDLPIEAITDTMESDSPTVKCKCGHEKRVHMEKTGMCYAPMAAKTYCLCKDFRPDIEDDIDDGLDTLKCGDRITMDADYEFLVVASDCHGSQMLLISGADTEWVSVSWLREHGYRKVQK